VALVVLADPSLSHHARSLVEDPANDKLVSGASLWEVTIKVSLGKYRLPRAYEEFVDHAVQGHGFALLPIAARHAAVLAGLPFHHRDPFDRLLAAQAIAEDVALVSIDAAFDAYGVRRLW
jgi:PIN domain nuclease of toxin-antitoxin system